MSKPLVSVVIPCFNVASTIAETLESVIAQTFGDLEIIAVDNNCTDDSVAILADIAAREPRLRIVRQPVQGLSAARNFGIACSRGDLIAPLDADDLWNENYLSRHLKNLSDETIGVSYSRIRLVDAAGRATGQVTRPKIMGLTATDLLRSNHCTSCSFIVVRRNVFDIAGCFNESFRRAEDQEWLFRVAYSGVRFGGINEVLGSYRTTPGAMSSDLDAMLEGHSQVLDVAAEFAPDLISKERRLAHAAMLRYCARRAVDHGKERVAARDYMLRMLRSAPDLILREPVPTLKTIAQVLLPQFTRAQEA